MNANFAFTEFYEVRITAAQHLWSSQAEIGSLRVLSDLLWLPDRAEAMGLRPALFWDFYGNDLRLWNDNRALVVVVEKDSSLGGSDKPEIWF